MISRLRQITIQDFRCISGKITVPLDAPVVLIHGPNGTGKTSILSAIELGLTGEVAAMERVDDAYMTHLVHRTSDVAKITLTASLPESEVEQTSTITIQNGEVNGKALLDKSMAHVFTERCNLAQSTLGRLLEIYQNASAREDSPLTRFVKDLLGLDRLEALIEGLSCSGDVRNTRKLAPKYKEAEDRRNELLELQKNERQQIEDAQSYARTVREKLLQHLVILRQPANPSFLLTEQSDVISKFLLDESEGIKLVALSQQRRQLAGMQAEWRSLAEIENSTARSAVEASERRATKLANDWRDTFGKELEAVLDKLRETFPDLPSSASTDPELARETAFKLANKEARRCSELIAEADSAINEISTLEQRIARHRSRTALLDEQISEITADTDTLAQSLASVIPHIHTDECPVCGRDFREVSTEPLVAYLSHRVARLTELSGRLQALSAEKGSTAAGLMEAEQALSVAKNRQISQEARVSLKSRSSHLAEYLRKLEELTPHTIAGIEILRTEAMERKRLAELRIRDQRATDLRIAILEFSGNLGQSAVDKADSIDGMIRNLENYIDTEEERLKDIQVRRQAALTLHREVLEIEGRISTMKEAFEARSKQLDSVEIEFEIAEKRRLEAKSIASEARALRTAIITQVFNDSLNKIWRDLFVRLAPSEPFVPTFKIPQSDRAVMAVLETVHRDGGRGGAPAAMLSAGNLNTAALTLFLALHLSAKDYLPWLILDDPVQSMDEVHITQFAALLRTLSKGHGRQIIMAVHDRALFDYLALELSPAFQTDQLVTLELSQSQIGATVAEPQFRIWAPDAVA